MKEDGGEYMRVFNMGGKSDSFMMRYFRFPNMGCNAK
jgi:hypothetical protein